VLVFPNGVVVTRNRIDFRAQNIHRGVDTSYTIVTSEPGERPTIRTFDPL
jgi:hypothetical protein